jgi:hypothetical protein
MKQICEKRQQVRINFGEWEDVSLFAPIVYGEPQAEWVWYVTFEDLYNAVKNGEIKNAYTSLTFWKKRPCVQFSTPTRELAKTITAKNFDKVEMRIRYTPVKNYSIKQLADCLSAEGFIEYCKDKGVAVRVD